VSSTFLIFAEGSSTSNGDDSSLFNRNIDNFLSTQRNIFLLDQDPLHIDDYIIDNNSSTQTPQLQQNADIRLPRSTNLIPGIHFGTHNINGFRNDITKLQHCMVFCNELNIDCVVLTETNTNARNGKFIDTRSYGYNSFWTGDNNKIKGSGVAILIAEHLQRFISKVLAAVPNYVLHITFLFRGCSLHVIGLYYPPNDQDIQQKIHAYIKHTVHNLKKDILNRVVILGDFNSVTNRFLDRTGSSRFYKKPSPLLNTLQQYLYIDTYRFMHPSGKQFTWNSQQSSLPTPIATRIDHIWVSPNWFADVTYCSIENMDIITQSDHNLATCVLHTGNIIRNHKISNQKRRDPPR
jgi:exonuclease III